MPFLTFEGIDGSGKSSLLELLADHLKKKSIPVEITREPGGTTIGKELREILLRKTDAPPCPETELLIYEADRAHHVQTKIKPLLAQGHWVLSDRYADSSVAFQGAGRKISKKDVEWLNRFATQGLQPEVTVLVDCPVAIGVGRIHKRGASDRFESEKTEFHEAVRREFLSLATTNKDRFLVLNSEKSTPEELFTQLLTHLKKRGLL